MFLRASAIMVVALMLSACGSVVVSTFAEQTHEPSSSIPPSGSAQPAATLTGIVFDAVCANNVIAALAGSELGETHLSNGTQITVSDGSNNVLALGRLEVSPDSPYRCDFLFTVDEVPPAAFYRIVVGGYQPLVFTKSELESKDWHLKLALDYRGDLGLFGSG